MDFLSLSLKKFVKKMFRINNRIVQNKRTEEKFDPEKIIVQYLIRIVQGENLDKKIIVHVQLFDT